MSRHFEVTVHATYDVSDDELRTSYAIDPLEPNRGALAAAVDAENYILDDIGSFDEYVRWVEVVVIENGTVIGRERRSR